MSDFEDNSVEKIDTTTDSVTGTTVETNDIDHVQTPESAGLLSVETPVNADAMGNTTQDVFVDKKEHVESADKDMERVVDAEEPIEPVPQMESVEDVPVDDSAVENGLQSDSPMVPAPAVNEPKTVESPELQSASVTEALADQPEPATELEAVTDDVEPSNKPENDGDEAKAAAVPEPEVEPSTAPEPVADDDDFDDFEDFTTAAATTSTSEPIPSLQSSSPVQESVMTPLDLPAKESLDGEEDIISQLLQDIGVSADDGYLGLVQRLLKKTFPIELDISDTRDLPSSYLLEPSDGQDLGSSRPSSAFESQDWYKMWMNLSTDASVPGIGSFDAQNTHEGFRWRKSHTRKIFMDSLTGSSSDLDESESEQRKSTVRRKSIQARESTTTKPASDASSQPSTAAKLLSETKSESQTYLGDTDAFERELLEAKKLCDVTEDEMRQKSTEEIRGLVQSLISYHQRLQAQANYWLDAKEKLVVDAEMQNRLIASLVQLAQQQQNAPRNAPKKKKAK